MVTLHIERGVSHGLRVRERGRVAEHQVEGGAALRLAREPGHDVGPLEAVAGTSEAIGPHVALRPGQVGLRQVDRGRGRGAACCRVQGGHARIGEQVEEALAPGHTAHHLARRAVVEEEPGVEVAAQVNLDQEPRLRGVGHVGGTARVAVLRTALAAMPHLREDIGRIDIEHGRHDGHGIGEAPGGTVGVHRCGGLVFRHAHEAVPGVGPRALVDVNGKRVIGKVRIVYAVSPHPFPAGPLHPLFRHLAQAGCELGAVGLGHRYAALGAGKRHHLHRLAMLRGCRV